ncbi:hypothetical protein JCM30237_28590 [Halolamina litorea]|uniref:Uncharacterized protein n=1 Tax=Halolamina litorea TaxID=1515593 RepID=A0ABD6BSP6_9EURY|nr:hypothetical protein [Halolamina litorea]
MGESSDDAGTFEFDQLSDSGDDPPDQPDPPDGAGDRNAPSRSQNHDGRGATARKGASSERDEEFDFDSVPEDTPPDGATGPESGAEAAVSNEPTAKDGWGDGEAAGGDDSPGDGEEASGSSAGSDDPDPPDPSDGSGESGSGFEFDPVTESRKAFHFAEKQSRAAAETAYSRVKGTWLWNLVKRYTSPEVRKRLDEVFSRRMLGSVLVGGAFTQIITVTIDAVLHDTAWWEIFVWVGVFFASLIIFVWWERLAHSASEAAAQAAEKATETAEKASEAASQAAEKASEAADEATDDTPEQHTAEVVGAGVRRASDRRDGGGTKPSNGANGAKPMGATAATRAGGKRPSAVRSRARGPERQPNKRYETERVTDGVAGRDPPAVFEGGKFANPGDDD